MNTLLAQRITLPDGTSIDGPINIGAGGAIRGGTLTLGAIVSNAVPFVFAFAGLGLLIMLVLAGFTYLTSAGDSKKLEQGKSQLTNAIIGFIIVFAAFWVVQIAGIVFGIKAFDIFN